MHGSPVFLMCPPECFDVAYVINPWMDGNVRNVDPSLAKRQWRALYDVLVRRVGVRLVRPEPSSPDMVFTANAGLVAERKVLVSRFRHEERQSEEPYFTEWFTEHAFEVVLGPRDVPFEGAGDALFDTSSRFVWLGYGHRTVPEAAELVRRTLDVEVLALELSDPRFYHLDTCLCPLPHGELLYYPPAFASASLAAIEARVPPALRLACSDDDAVAFACNAVAWDQTVVLNSVSASLERTLSDRGYRVVTTPLSEFMKAGGSAKCLTLRVE